MASNAIAWELLSDQGPPAAFHAGCVIENSLIVHGGISKQGNTTPRNDLFQFNSVDLSWTNLSSVDSPFLSHHTAVALHDRYVMLIGGWNGKTRTSNLCLFDIQQKHWLFPRTSGFPSGAGLSSHTSNLLSNGDIIIIGREGSLRTQRRNGSAFLLSGDIRKGFEYKILPLGVSSRSGHSTCIINNSLYIIGGRDDNFVEVHNGYKTLSNPSSQLSIIEKSLYCVSNLKQPGCRKNHVAFTGYESILLHGGETFDGRVKGPIDDLLLLKIKPELRWYALNASSICRTGHVGFHCRDYICIHGGFGNEPVASTNLYKLSYPA